MCKEDTARFLAIFLATFCFSLVEYWLGRTEKVKSNSIWELVINILLRRKL
jgi:hypothetical protein